MSRIDWESDQFLYFIQRNIFHFFNSILLCAGIVFIVWLIDFKIAIFLVITTLLPVIITRVFGKMLEKCAKKMRAAIGELNGNLFEVIKGMQDIRLLCGQKWAQSKIAVLLKKLIGLGNASRRIDFHSNKVIYIINLLSSFYIYWVCMQMIFDKQLSMGMFLAIIEFTALLHRKFNWILMIYVDWFSRKVSMDRVTEILDTESEDNKGIPFDEPIRSIVFHDVTFAYGKTLVLQKVSFSIQKGEKVAVAGPSGVGKTTIVNLILRLFDAQSGNVCINGKDVRDLQISDIRKKISVLNQDILLMNGTIRDNLLLGIDTGKTDAELMRVCDDVLLGDQIRSLPKGLDTAVNQREMDLSGGQKQRLMLARLLLKDADVLILDEATSALDIQTEDKILKVIFEKYADKTILVISHRPHTVAACDRTIVLKDGRLYAQGTHDELIEDCEFYYQLFGSTTI